jgi:hypothetical protein
VAGALTVAGIHDDRYMCQSSSQTGVKMRVRIVSMDHVETTFGEQSSHLRNLSDSTCRLQLMDDPSGISNFIGKAADLSDRKELGQTGRSIMMSGKVCENPFESTGF